MSSRPMKHTKDEEFLIGVAESIGSTLGSIAAQANAAPKNLMESDFVHSVESEGKSILRKAQTAVRHGKKTASQKIREMQRTQIGKTIRRGLTGGKAAAKRTVRLAASKAKTRRVISAKKTARKNKRRS
jgi:hypothetical protein